MKTCRLRALGGLLTALLVFFGAQAPAYAQVYYGYAYGFGWGYDAWGYPPMPVVVAHGPPLLTFDNQIYPVTVPGISRMCGLHPEICETPDLTKRLHQLERLRVAGITLAWTGFSAAVLGPIISTAVNCASDEDYCRPNDAIMLSTVLGGLAVGITGLVIMPTGHSVIDYVNRINTVHVDHPVQIKLGMLETVGGPRRSLGAPYLALSKSF